MATKVEVVVSPPDLSKIPECKFKYASADWVNKHAAPWLGAEVMSLISQMSAQLSKCRITVICAKMSKGDIFGHGCYHLDGFGTPDEVHRLLTFGGTPTLGRDGKTLTVGEIWQFSGDYYHKAQPSSTNCKRLLIRVSQTDLPYRNFWENIPCIDLFKDNCPSLGS